MVVDAKKLGVDYMTMAGHKIYATKGVGILYIRDGLFGAETNHPRRQSGARTSCGNGECYSVRGNGKGSGTDRRRKGELLSRTRISPRT